MRRVATPRNGKVSPSRAAGGRNVVALLGGLGNQLFQVAFGRWLEQGTGRETCYDASCSRDLALDVRELPGIGADVDGRLLTATARWPTPHGRMGPIGRAIRMALGPRRIACDFAAAGSSIPENSEAAWWFGYWQRKTYADGLLPGLAESLAAVRNLAPRPVIGVHVRRSDMLSTSTEVPAAWFGPAVARVRNELAESRGPFPVRVWSDDPAWCQRKLDLGVPFDVASAASAIEHMAELAGCQALVISRSTFSWWPAALASERGALVAFPAPWWSGTNQLDPVIIPASWLPLPCDRAAQTASS